MERKSAEVQIDYELPFATINMAAIAGSLINPVKIFEIIISSDEFPSVKKEITKLMNSVNVYGEDIVTALRNASYTSPSKKMSELFNGLATTINSGGDLTNFFETRAESLLFDYKINREKETKTAETFMDLYISIVIAAPMIFMLLLMMIKISGLGISLATSTITLIMVGSVFMINIFFLVYLHLKKTG
jgi:flagellar protein FlaJ